MEHATRLPWNILRIMLACLVLITMASVGRTEAQESFSATHFGLLTSNEEVPPVAGGAAAGNGIAIMRLDVDNGSLEYRISVVFPLGDSITAAHFHRAPKGQNGSPVHVINFPPGQWTATGTWSSISSEDIQALAAGSIYVNVHTVANPEGQIRAQVVPIPNISAQQLGPEQETPPVSGSNGTGSAGLWLDLSANRAIYHVEWDSLTGPPTMAHFHRGEKGVAGPPVFTIPLPSPAPIRGSVDGIWDNISPSDVTDLRAGRFYVNIHTATNQPGEIRGQLYTSEAYTAAISPANEVPPVSGTSILGTGFTLVQGDGQLTGAWLIGRKPATNAHIHKAPKGQNGDIIYELAGLAGLIWFRFSDGTPITSDDWAAFRASGMYVNFHTQDFPTGESRGQLIPAMNNLPPLPSAVPSLEPGTASDKLAVFYDPSGMVRFSITGNQATYRDADVSLYSPLGELIASSPVKGGQVVMATGHLPAGVYFAQLVVNGVPSGFSRVAVVR